ncbi:carbohydrate ABC transporter permease [Thermasporomyces composti]|jgi:ABC-type sugar transport system permease subunit|uniref:Carbohydrate ABC transporter membrane protein 1 (CUT1 family) n=1 Tax=Thermasporomyces composti TaxID=696763 RepID=A0A3D9V427_THECX|nr:sugar ABC transporter permease [Thermasporomyces composti]REF35443.1 carbohydrate ABC transporter membrane protein 1 (CUT1 family) [Thermasporomyces composti]
MNADTRTVGSAAARSRRSSSVGRGPGQNRRSLRARLRENRAFYLTIAPFFVLFALFGAFPIVASFAVSFVRWDGLSEPEFVGLGNYLILAEDPVFRKAIWNTIYIWLGSTVATMALAFGLAYLINEYVLVAKGFFRVVYLFPLLVAPAVTGIIASVMFSSHAGIVNAVLSLLSDERVTFDWLRSTFWIKPLVILLIVWRWTGWHLIIFMAGLQAIPRDLYNAARVDGANERQVFRHVTLPLMVPFILYSAISSTVGAFQLFDEPYVLTNGTYGTANSAQVLGTYLYQSAFQEFKFGLASATSYVIFALILVFSLINARLLRRQA